jgi:hypothetical protein
MDEYAISLSKYILDPGPDFHMKMKKVYAGTLLNWYAGAN